MSAITNQKADNLLRLPEAVTACNRQPGLLRHGAGDKKLWILAFWLLISGGILNGICPSPAQAGALYIYEMANPSDTGYKLFLFLLIVSLLKLRNSYQESSFDHL